MNFTKIERVLESNYTPVLALPEAVTLVACQQVPHRDRTALQRTRQLLALRTRHTWVVGTLGNQQRLCDLVRLLQ